jgi:hypothetical protein
MLSPRRRLVACVTLALAGGIAHNALELGWGALLTAETFSIPWVAVWVGLAVAWNRRPDSRRPIELTMLGLALLSLIVGAIASVLPLDALPFDPEQTVGHYLTHLVYALSQLPLIWLLIRLRRGSPVPVDAV